MKINLKKLFEKRVVGATENQSARYFTLGMEIEFCVNNYDLQEKYWTYMSRQVYSERAILGEDGSGLPTAEFRSPVFISRDPLTALNRLVDFATSVQEQLISEYKSVFLPYFGNMPMGIHFSIGGKFIKEFKSYYERARTVQSQLIEYVPQNVLSLYKSRERCYPGDLPTFNEFLGDGCGFREPNGIRVKGDGSVIVHKYQPELFSEDNFFFDDYDDYDDYGHAPFVEFRFLPSCLVKSLTSRLEYILLGGSVPKSMLEFSPPQEYEVEGTYYDHDDYDDCESEEDWD